MPRADVGQSNEWSPHAREKVRVSSDGVILFIADAGRHLARRFHRNYLIFGGQHGESQHPAMPRQKRGRFSDFWF